MAEHHKGIAMVILGIVAIIAVVGLVLLFTAGKSSTGSYVAASPKIYGGDLRADRNEFPYWADGVATPRNIPGDMDNFLANQQNWNTKTHWNYYGNPTGNPIGDIPSPMVKCGVNGFRVPLNDDQAGWYRSQGYQVIDPGDGRPGMCVYLADDQRSMMGGVAGWTG